MEKLAVRCGGCGAAFRVDARHAGKRVRCTKCEAPLQVPGPDEARPETGAVPDEARTEAAVAPATPPPFPPPHSPLVARADAERARTPAEPSRPALGLPLLAAAGAALAGAVAWALLLRYAHREIGWLAWGIGLGVGMAMQKTGARGPALGAAAGMLTLVAIAGGKVIGWQLAIPAQASLQEMRTDAVQWQALGDLPSEAEIRGFMVDRGYTGATLPAQVSRQEVEAFAEYSVPTLEYILAEEPTEEEWRRLGWTWRDSFEAAKRELGPLDLVFAGLGLFTAFGLVNRPPGQRRRRG